MTADLVHAVADEEPDVRVGAGLAGRRGPGQGLAGGVETAPGGRLSAQEISGRPWGSVAVKAIWSGWPSWPVIWTGSGWRRGGRFTPATAIVNDSVAWLPRES